MISQNTMAHVGLNSQYLCINTYLKRIHLRKHYQNIFYAFGAALYKLQTYSLSTMATLCYINHSPQQMVSEKYAI